MRQWPAEANNPCGCGCGQLCRNLFVSGHNKSRLGYRKTPGPDHIEEDRGYKTPCWIWQHAKSKAGYGMKSVNNKRFFVHKLNYESHIGAVPEGKELDHLCRVRQCVNPHHLEPVSHIENMQRGARSKLTTEKVQEAIARCAAGETRKSVADSLGVDSSVISEVVRGIGWGGVGTLPKARKLTAESAEDIRRRVTKGERQVDLAKEYGLHPVYVGEIVHGKRWKRKEAA